MDADRMVAALKAQMDEDKRAAEALIAAVKLPGKLPDFSGCGGPAAEAYWQRFDPAREVEKVAAIQLVIAEDEDCQGTSNSPDYYRGLWVAIFAFAEAYRLVTP